MRGIFKDLYGGHGLCLRLPGVQMGLTAGYSYIVNGGEFLKYK